MNTLVKAAFVLLIISVISTSVHSADPASVNATVKDILELKNLINNQTQKISQLEYQIDQLQNSNLQNLVTANGNKLVIQGDLDIHGKTRIAEDLEVHKNVRVDQTITSSGQVSASSVKANNKVLAPYGAKVGGSITLGKTGVTFDLKTQP